MEDPITRFTEWLDVAVAAGLTEPTAMCLATVGDDGPDARMVLLKAVDQRGFVFYTNYTSAKAAQLAARPQACLVFPWLALQRQVRVTGTVAKIPAEESSAYFASRPRGSQLGAWASAQSSVLASRRELEDAYAAAATRWPEGTPVPRPEHWGGYLLTPRTVEFWQGRSDRLHDRLRFRRAGAGWVVERLAP